MLSDIQRQIRSSWEKNGPDLRAFLSGRLGRILRSSEDGRSNREIPVFTFHSVKPEPLEAQFRYLAENNYRTLDSEGLAEVYKNGAGKDTRAVVLTFDDATGSFWATAFPLLEKYKFRAILFVIPGLVPEDSTRYPNLNEVWEGRADREEILKRETIQPLCTWSELLEMHKTGIVDIQSHSLTHSLINVSPRVVDFIHPKYNTYFYENVSVPVSRDDSIERPSRHIRFGQPVYESSSRLRGHHRFLEDTSIGEELVRYVEKNGGTEFFLKSNWRRKLYRKNKRFTLKGVVQTAYETQQDTEAAITLELSRSKELLEQRLPGKIIRHLCYPFFQGGLIADRIAAECGYRYVYYGPETGSPTAEQMTITLKVCRVSEEYLFCLPGQGRISIMSVWKWKVSHLLKRG